MVFSEGMDWWNSVPRMARITRTTTIAAAASFCVAAAGWPFTWVVAVLGAVVGTALVLCAAFAWFRLDHLREIGG